MYELKRIDPARTARLLAIIYGALFGLLALFAIPMFLLAPTGAEHGYSPPKGLMIVLLLLYPLFGAGMGWLTGQVISRIYNRAAQKLGGLLFDVRQVERTTG
jgi:hypothetical protein